MDRRTFVKAVASEALRSLIQGLDPLVRADLFLPSPPIELQRSARLCGSPLGLPGLFPGRVVEIREPKAIVGTRVTQSIVRRLLERAMTETDRREIGSGRVTKIHSIPKDIVGIRSIRRVRLLVVHLPNQREIIDGSPVGECLREISSSTHRYSYEMDIGSYQTAVADWGSHRWHPGTLRQRVVARAECLSDANFFGEWKPILHGKDCGPRSNEISTCRTMKDHSGIRGYWSSQEPAYGISITLRAPIKRRILLQIL